MDLHRPTNTCKNIVFSYIHRHLVTIILNTFCHLFFKPTSPHKLSFSCQSEKCQQVSKCYLQMKCKTSVWLLEQEAGQKHFWPMTPVIIPTPPCYVRAVVCLARGPWGYGASTQSISTCHHPVDIRVFVFPVSHPLGGSCQVCNWSFFTFLIFSYFMLCYETQWRLFSEWFWLSPCPDWNFI